MNKRKKTKKTRIFTKHLIQCITLCEHYFYCRPDTNGEKSCESTKEKKKKVKKKKKKEKEEE